MFSSILAMIEAETSRPVPPEVTAIAQAAIEKYPAHSIDAVLFYGSCFRDCAVGDGLIDLYLLARDAEAIYPSKMMRFFATRIPPNVYFIDLDIGGRTIRAKYAILTLEQFELKVRPEIRNPYFWARFAQPTGIVMANDRPRVQRALGQAIETLTAHAKALTKATRPDIDFWTRILRQTYRTELRVEKPNRTKQIFDADAERYKLIRAHANDCNCSKAPWWLRRIEGRLISVARLIKASFTFQGGPDYLAWKIERHSGVRLNLTPWQKRHPIMASGPILWSLWRSKTVR